MPTASENKKATCELIEDSKKLQASKGRAESSGGKSGAKGGCISYNGKNQYKGSRSLSDELDARSTFRSTSGGDRDNVAEIIGTMIADELSFTLLSQERAEEKAREEYKREVEASTEPSQWTPNVKVFLEEDSEKNGSEKAGIAMLSEYVNDAPDSIDQYFTGWAKYLDLKGDSKARSEKVTVLKEGIKKFKEDNPEWHNDADKKSAIQNLISQKKKLEGDQETFKENDLVFDKHMRFINNDTHDTAKLLKDLSVLEESMTAIRQNRYNEKIGAGVVENLLIQHVTTCKETLIKITNKESISDQDKKELGNSLAALGYVHLDYPPDKSYYVSYDSDSAVKTERAISDFSQTKTDLCRHLAVRIVLGDHDANTGNFQVTKDGRIVGIDFGHVFNNQLLNRGNVNRHNKSNSALDFLNRDYLSLNIELVKRGANTPKIWRDYPALVYSKDMANALAKMGNMEAKGRSNTSKQIFLEIITSIQSGTYKEKSSDWKKNTINNILKSLKQVQQGCGNPELIKEKVDDPIVYENIKVQIEQAFTTFEKFTAKNIEDTKFAAQLMNFQLKVDDFIKEGGGENENDVEKLKIEYDKIAAQAEENGIKTSDGIKWMRTPLKLKESDKDKVKSSQIKGNLLSYVKQRSDELLKDQSEEITIRINAIKAVNQKELKRNKGILDLLSYGAGEERYKNNDNIIYLKFLMEFTKKLAESAISSAEEESWKLEGIYESFDKFNFNSSVREKLWNLYYEKSSDNPHLTQEKFFCYLYDSGVCDILNSCYTKKSEISKKENINHSSIIKEATLRVAELYPILNNIDYEKITDSEVGEFQNKLILNSKKAKILGDVLDDREDAETIPKSHEEYIALVKKISAETDSFITKNRISINNIISLCQNIRNLALNKTEANSNYKNSERELSAIKITIDGQGRDFYGSVVKYGVKYSKYGEDDYFQRVAGGNNIGSDEFKEFRKKALTAILERYNKEKTALDTARESGDMLQRLNLISETFRMLYLGHFLSDGNSEICYLMLNMMLHENNLPLYRSHELTAASEFNQGNISPYFLADLMQKDLMRGMEDYIKKADENDLIQSKDYLQRKENFYKLYKTTELQKKERGDIEKNLEIEKDKMKKSSDTDIGEFLKKKLSRTKEKIANKEDYILGKSDKITGDGLNKERKTHKRKTREGLKNYINYLKSKGTEESEIAKDTVIEELFKKLKTIEKDNYNKSDNDSKKKIAAVNNIIHESGSYEYWKKFLELDDIYVRPDLEENVKNIGEKYVGKGDLGKITQRIERVNNKNEFNTSHGYNKIQHHRSSINSTYHAEIIKRLKSHYKDLDDDNIDPDSDKELQDFYKALYGILEKQLEDGKLNIKGAESIFDTVSEVNKEAMADFLRFCVSKSNDDNSVKNRLREILFDNFQVQKKQWEQEAETLPDQKSSPDSKEAAEDQKSPSSSQASDKISEINKNLFFNSFDILKKEFINSEEKEHYEGKEHLILYFLKHRRFAEIKTLLVDLVGSDKRNELLADKINCVKYDSANPANPDNQTLLNKNIIEWALEFGYKEGEFNTLLALGFRPEQSADHKFGNRKITKIKERRSELGKSLDKYFVEVSPGNPSNDALKNILKYMQEFKDNPDELWQFLIFNEVTNPNYNISAQSNLDKLVIILESSADKSNKNEILKLLIKNISLKAGEDEKDDLSQEGFKKISKMAKRAMLSDPRIFKETLKEKGLKAIAQDLGSELNSFPVYDIQAVYAKKTLDALSKITTFEENKSPDTLKNNGDYISLKKQFYYNYILNQDLVEDPRITEKENDFLKTILTGNINGLKFTKANGEEVDISKTINNLVATKFKDIKNIDIVKRMILEQRLDLFKDRINDSDSSYSSFITALPDEYNNLKDVTPDSIIKTNNQNNETSALSYKEGEKIILPSSGRVQEILNNIATQDGRKEIFEKTNGKISNLIHGPHVNQVEKTPNHLDLTLHLNKNQTFTINTQLDNYSSYKLCVTLDCKGSITGEVYFKDINNNRVANDNSVRTLLSDLPADYQLDIHAGGNNKVIKWDDISQKITNPYPKTSPQNPSSPPINNQAATNNTSSPTTISI